MSLQPSIMEQQVKRSEGIRKHFDFYFHNRKDVILRDIYNIKTGEHVRKCIVECCDLMDFYTKYDFELSMFVLLNTFKFNLMENSTPPRPYRVIRFNKELLSLSLKNFVTAYIFRYFKLLLRSTNFCVVEVRIYEDKSIELVFSFKCFKHDELSLVLSLYDDDNNIIYSDVLHRLLKASTNWSFKGDVLKYKIKNKRRTANNIKCVNCVLL